MPRLTAVLALACVLLGCSAADESANLDQLAPAMTFYASYEDGMDAAYARDDRRLYSAPSYERLADRGPWYWGDNVKIAYGSGIAGNALSFAPELSQAVFYAAEGNVPWTNGGALSVWLRPDAASGTPVAVYGGGASSATLALALAPDPPRLAATVLQDEAETEFAGQAGVWRHVAVSFDGTTATLYVDGEPQASISGERPSWTSEDSTIRLGVDYGGLLDELALFDRALTHEEVRMLYRTPSLPGSLMR